MNKLLECKINDAAVKASGEIRGIASVFDIKDQGGDIIESGAFKDSLVKSGGIVPLLNGHTQQIGWVTNASEVSSGLKFAAQLDIKNNATAREAHSLATMGVAMGAKVGLSIGYVTKRHSFNKDFSERTLHEVDLKEISLVPVPMNEEAMVTSVKNSSLTDDAPSVDDISKIESLLDQAFNALEQKNE